MVYTSRNNGQKDSTRAQVETRRTKRRTDESNKAPQGSVKRRRACTKDASNNPYASQSNTRKKSAKKTKAERISNGPVKSKGRENKSARNQSVISLLKSSQIDDKLVSAVSAQINRENHTSQHSEEEKSDADTLSPLTKTKRTDPQRKNDRQTPADSSITRRKDDDSEEQHEYRKEDQQFEESDYLDSDTEQEEDVDGNEAEIANCPIDQDKLTKALGESDEEIEVSFHNSGAKDSNEKESSDGDVDVPRFNINSQNDRIDVHTLRKDLDGASEAELNKFKILDDSVIVNIVHTMKKAIVNEVESSLSQLVTEIRTDREQIQRLREHILELTSIVSTTASAIFIKHVASQPRAKEIQQKLCLLPAIFSDQIMLKILPRVIMGFFFNNIVPGSPYTIMETKGVRFLSILFFSKKPNEKKKREVCLRGWTDLFEISIQSTLNVNTCDAEQFLSNIQK